jgi:hypothetical protein
MTLDKQMNALTFVGLHWARVWNTHNGDGMAALFHAHATYTDPFAGTIGASDIPAMMTRITELFPDFVFALVGAVTEAEVKGRRTLALQWRMHGTQARTKSRIDFPGVDFLEFDGPLIIQANTYFDRVELQKQSGLAMDELTFKLGIAA